MKKVLFSLLASLLFLYSCQNDCSGIPWYPVQYYFTVIDSTGDNYIGSGKQVEKENIFLTTRWGDTVDLEFFRTMTESLLDSSKVQWYTWINVDEEQEAIKDILDPMILHLDTLKPDTIRFITKDDRCYGYIIHGLNVNGEWAPSPRFYVRN